MVSTSPTPTLLRRYARAQRHATLPLYSATNAIVRLYTDNSPPARLLLRRRVAEENAAFRAVIAAWTQLREQLTTETRRAVLARWEPSILQSRLKELEYAMKLQHRRMRMPEAQLR
jgi:hypothetical protein